MRESFPWRIFESTEQGQKKKKRKGKIHLPLFGCTNACSVLDIADIKENFEIRRTVLPSSLPRCISRRNDVARKEDLKNSRTLLICRVQDTSSLVPLSRGEILARPPFERFNEPRGGKNIPREIGNEFSTIRKEPRFDFTMVALEKDLNEERFHRSEKELKRRISFDDAGEEIVALSSVNKSASPLRFVKWSRNVLSVKLKEDVKKLLFLLSSPPGVNTFSILYILQSNEIESRNSMDDPGIG